MNWWSSQWQQQWSSSSYTSYVQWTWWKPSPRSSSIEEEIKKYDQKTWEWLTDSILWLTSGWSKEKEVKVVSQPMFAVQGNMKKSSSVEWSIPWIVNLNIDGITPGSLHYYWYIGDVWHTRYLLEEAKNKNDTYFVNATDTYSERSWLHFESRNSSDRFRIGSVKLRPLKLAILKGKSGKNVAWI